MKEDFENSEANVIVRHTNDIAKLCYQLLSDLASGGGPLLDEIYAGIEKGSPELKNFFDINFMKCENLIRYTSASIEESPETYKDAKAFAAQSNDGQHVKDYDMPLRRNGGLIQRRKI